MMVSFFRGAAPDDVCWVQNPGMYFLFTYSDTVFGQAAVARF
jgi:hypothetical protein